MSDLYIQDSSLYLSLKEDKILVRDKERLLVKEISIYKVENVLIFGLAQLTTQLLQRLALKKVNVYYFTSYGKFLSVLETYREADFEKQSWQTRACLDEDFCKELSRKLLTTKVRHQIQLLEQYDEDKLLDSADYERLEEQVRGLEAATSIAEMMGYEGRAAKSYFYFLSLLVPQEFRFSGRSKRPAKDPFNSLLNLGYSVLHTFMIGLIRKHGLSQGTGVLHQVHRGHATLASDLMEEWRPIIVDDTVVHLLQTEQLGVEHFKGNEEQGMFLTPEGREIFLSALRCRILEIHQYVELDKKRYSFPYTVDLQLQALLRAFEERDASLYTSSYAGE